ncbi:MAG: rRNA maturation RNase YbeY [Balneolaceae bacterium]
MDDRVIPELYNPSNEPLPISQAELSSLSAEIERHEHIRFSFLEVVFIASDEMIRMNRDHKQHNHLTDILTFPYHDEGAAELEASLFCSPFRIREQAIEWSVPESEEFCRVFIHGLLHLCGYDDQTEDDQKRMKMREEFYLSIWRASSFDASET